MMSAFRLDIKLKYVILRRFKTVLSCSGVAEIQKTRKRE